MSWQPADREPASVMKAGSSSFALASRLFDPTTRMRARLLYGWCRHCDDMIDGQVLGRAQSPVTAPLMRLAELRDRSVRAVRGDVSGGPPFAALARVVAETELPHRFVADHLIGYEMDVTGQRFETLDETLSYCYHIAGVVGLMMAWVMGVRDRETLLRGCDLGIAFQLTNIARDIDDDAVAGRVYVPLAWAREQGVVIRAGESLDGAARRAIVPVVSRLLIEADRYYASASYGIRRLPTRSAWAVTTARHVYADIGAQVLRLGERAWDTRVATTRTRKLWRLAQAAGETAWALALRRSSCTPERHGLWSPPLESVLG